MVKAPVVKDVNALSPRAVYTLVEYVFNNFHESNFKHFILSGSSKGKDKHPGVIELKGVYIYLLYSDEELKEVLRHLCPESSLVINNGF